MALGFLSGFGHSTEKFASRRPFPCLRGKEVYWCSAGAGGPQQRGGHLGGFALQE